MTAKLFNEEDFKNSLGIPDELPDALNLDSFPNFNRRTKVEFSLELTVDEKRIALKNALRYFPAKHQNKELSKEFLQELDSYGHIYMYRFCPYKTEEEYEEKMLAFPLSDYLKVCKTSKAAAIMLMIQNNLDKTNALFPLELITYGSNGSVFQNWIQYRLTMKYLSEMEDDQTLVMYSGHPLGLFPSHKNSPKVVITNGMMIPLESGRDEYDRYNAIGVTQYGQMTAGSFMYIGSQGIVHGTTITLLYAARRKEEKTNTKIVPETYTSLKETLKGKLFVSSGLGGMSRAQPKAAEILGAIAIIAEVKLTTIEKAQKEKWIGRTIITKNKLKDYKDEILFNRSNKISCSYAYHGNIVDLWNELLELNITPDFGSDQTSLHNPHKGGYIPIDFSETNGDYSEDKFSEYLKQDAEIIKKKVDESLKKQIDIVLNHIEKGMFFFEYGNDLLGMIEDWTDNLDEIKTKIPSYVKDIMGPKFFDYGFGPFRWVCTSGNDPSQSEIENRKGTAELKFTDSLAEGILQNLYESASDDVKTQIYDNLLWIREAWDNELVNGSQARILYADAQCRIEIAKAFNKAIKEKKISAPIVLGRDHHDVSGTDSPNRETNNIADGSNVTADMAIQNVIGDSFRGATWVSIHNGGGVGWGKAINGGFGMVIQGEEQDEENINSMFFWDVNNGIARRSWAGNEGAIDAIKREMARNNKLKITLHNQVDEEIIETAF